METHLISYQWLMPIGVIVGTIGTLIGAGGGFILVPLLILMYPYEKPEFITSLSLIVVFFNAVSGSISYARMKRIDYKSGLLFSLATIPGAVLGSLAIFYIPKEVFNLIFGILMIITSVYLFFNKKQSLPATKKTIKGVTTRHLEDSEGNNYDYSFNNKLGVSISTLVGFFSSLLGIGGGIIHVPVMINLLNFPVHIATATSQFVLAFMALAGSITNLLSGKLNHGINRIILLSIGVLLGAQLGAKLSKNLRGTAIIKVLSIGLFIAGLKIIFTGK